MTGAKIIPLRNARTQHYRGTNFRKIERNPRLDEVCSLIEKSGFSCYEISQRVIRISGGGAYISPQTISNWLNNSQQRRAHNYGLDWVERALGYERRLVFIGIPQ